MKTAVFVSGPYTQGNVKENIKKSIVVADKLIEAGFLPLVPHLWYYIEKHNKRDYDTWFNLASALLDRADCLLRMPGESPRADREVEKAVELGMPIFNSIEDLLEALPDGNI